MYTIKGTSIADNRGVLSIVDFRDIPFVPVRAFTISGVPAGTARGNHAHRTCRQYLMCVHGKVQVTSRWFQNKTLFRNDTLLHPGDGICIPEMTWSEQKYDYNSVLLVFCDQPYDEKDYIRDRKEFDKIANEI